MKPSLRIRLLEASLLLALADGAADAPAKP